MTLCVLGRLKIGVFLFVTGVIYNRGKLENFLQGVGYLTSHVHARYVTGLINLAVCNDYVLRIATLSHPRRDAASG